MKRTAIILATCLSVLSSVYAKNRITVTAIKRDADLTDNGAILQVFKDAINASNITVVTDAVSESGDVADDARFYHIGNARWQNFGMDSATSFRIVLRFEVDDIPGFEGSVVSNAQLRFYHSSGGGSTALGRIFTHPWIEGVENGNYPGAAGGVSLAHPAGKNTSVDQNKDGGSTPPWQSWGVGASNFFDMATDCVTNRSRSSREGAGAGWMVFNVQDIVQDWANGTNNYGFGMDVESWTINLSEIATLNRQPVLFLEYIPNLPLPGTVVTFR